MRLFLFFLLFSVGAHAQTMEARRVKEEMLKRTELMRLNSEEAGDLFKSIQLAEACIKINGIFKEMPNHLSSIMSRMNVFDRKIQNMKNESLDLLKEIHRLENRCQQGDNQELVDPDKAHKFLKGFSRTMKKHEKLIKKSQTDYNNTYYYQYEF